MADLSLDVRKTLSNLQLQLELAREALADEAEGRFYLAVLQLEHDSHQLAELVRAW